MEICHLKQNFNVVLFPIFLSFLIMAVSNTKPIMRNMFWHWTLTQFLRHSLGVKQHLCPYLQTYCTTTLQRNVHLCFLLENAPVQIPQRRECRRGAYSSLSVLISDSIRYKISQKWCSSRRKGWADSTFIILSGTNNNGPVTWQMPPICCCRSLKTYFNYKLSRKSLSVCSTWGTSCAPPPEVTDYVPKNRKRVIELFVGSSWERLYLWPPGWLVHRGDFDKNKYYS